MYYIILHVILLNYIFYKLQLTIVLYHYLFYTFSEKELQLQHVHQRNQSTIFQIIYLLLIINFY